MEFFFNLCAYSASGWRGLGLRVALVMCCLEHDFLLVATSVADNSFNLDHEGLLTRPRNDHDTSATRGRRRTLPNQQDDLGLRNGGGVPETNDRRIDTECLETPEENNRGAPLDDPDSEKTTNSP